MAAGDAPQPPQSGWRLGMRRTPIVVMGSPGAGNTEVWRHLTGGSVPHAMSTTNDQG